MVRSGVRASFQIISCIESGTFCTRTEVRIEQLETYKEGNNGASDLIRRMGRGDSIGKTMNINTEDREVG